MADNESSQQQSVGGVADAGGAPGSYSNSAITSLHAGERLPASRDEQILAAKISRAMASGPFRITRDATVAEMDAQGNLVVLRQGTNQWVCFPGDENKIGNVPMCADPMGLQWMRDIMAGKPAPTNPHPNRRLDLLVRAVLKGHSDMNIYTPELVQRNATFAASGAFRGLPFPTNPALRVIGCVDSRVDPSDVLGLKLDEAVVMRNI